MTINLNAVDKLEILTLQDNYIDVAAMTALIWSTAPYP